jgi:hypothetical protein
VVRRKPSGLSRPALAVAQHPQDDKDSQPDEQEREEVEQAGRPVRQEYLHAVPLPKG